jgi:hypothetical protein
LQNVLPTPNYVAICPLFDWVSPKIIQKTFENTTHLARIPCLCKDYGILDKPRWKQFKPIAKHENTITQMFKQEPSKPLLFTWPLAISIKYNFEVPCTYDQATCLDQQKEQEQLWKESVALELQQINKYQSFIVKGHHTKTSPLAGYKNICVHLVIDL